LKEDQKEKQLRQEKIKKHYDTIQKPKEEVE